MAAENLASDDRCLFQKPRLPGAEVQPRAGHSGRYHRHHPLSPMQVEFCKSFGDPTKPRAWSRHAQKPSQSKQPAEDKDPVPPETKKVHRSLLLESPVSAGWSPLGLSSGNGMT